MTISRFLPLICALGAACALPDDSSEQALRYTPLVDAWSDVECMTSGGTDRCFAQTPSADDLWFPVVSWCELARRLDDGEYMAKADDWTYTCDSGGHPQTFDSFLCFDVQAGWPVCFGGSGGWYTQVEPECFTSDYSQPAWPAVGCDPNTNDPGPHDFDAVNVVPGGYPDWGRVTNGDDAFYAVPPCAVPTLYPAGDPWSC